MAKSIYLYIKQFIFSTKESLFVISAMYLVHFAKSIQLSSAVKKTSVDIFSRDDVSLFVSMVFFKFRLLLVFLLIYLFFAAVQKFWSRNSFLVPIGLALVLNLISYFFYPQLYDDFVFIGKLLHSVEFLLTIITVRLLLSLIIFVFLLRLLFIKRTTRNILLCFICITPFIYIFFVFNFNRAPSSSNSGPTYQISSVNKKPSMVILSVDSLNSTQDLKSADSHPALRKFLESAQQFSSVITTQPQTHVSLTSFLSEQTPQVSNLRDYLDSSATKNTDYFIGPTLKELKKAGYNLGFLMDTQAFALFEDDGFFTEFFTPRQGVATFVFPSYLRSGIFWLFFNNGLGELVFPEIKYNSEFSVTYRLSRFTKMVNDTIANLAQKDQPFVLFVHTCAMHWPGIVPYPYHLNYSNERFPFKSYDSRYFTPVDNMNLTTTDWNLRASENVKTYEKMLNWVKDDFLEPLLASSRQNSERGEIKYVIMSDHGEDFWIGTKLPAKKFPTHTRSSIFNSHSNKIAFYVGTNQTNRTPIEKALSITDLMPLLMDYLKTGKIIEDHKSIPRYSESGVWPYSYPDSFSVFDVNELASFFYYDSSDQHFYSNFNLGESLIQKTRSVQDENFRLSVYSTDYGFQYFLCDLRSDLNCIINLAGTKNEITIDFLHALNSYNRSDIQKGFYPKLVLDLERPGFLRIQTSDFELGWLKILRAYEALHKYGNVKKSQTILSDFYLRPASSIKLKEYAFMLRLEYCKAGNYFDTDQQDLAQINSKEDLAQFIQKNEVMGSGDNAVHLRLIHPLYECISNTKKKFDVVGAVASLSEDPQAFKAWVKYVEAFDSKYDQNETIAILKSILSDGHGIESLEPWILYYLVMLGENSKANVDRLFDLPTFTLLSPIMKPVLLGPSSKASSKFVASYQADFVQELAYNFPSLLRFYYDGMYAYYSRGANFNNYFSTIISDFIPDASASLYYRYFEVHNKIILPVTQLKNLLQQKGAGFLDVNLILRAYTKYVYVYELCKLGKVDAKACANIKFSITEKSLVPLFKTIANTKLTLAMRLKLVNSYKYDRALYL